MEIQIDNKTLTNALEDVWMKGKYHNGESAKNSQLADYAMLEMIQDNLLNLYNADNQTICRVSVPVIRNIGRDANNMMVVEIDKMMKYLKTFTGDSVLLAVTDYITLKDLDGGKTATMPLVVNHPSASMIARIQNYTITPENPVFSRVTFETVITTGSKMLTEAIKTCDVINNAKYKFDTDGEDFHISSSRSNIDTVDVEVPTLSIEGDPSTVEITGQFHKFFRGSVPVVIYLKDESPVIWSGEDRILVKAPYLARG